MRTSRAMRAADSAVLIDPLHVPDGPGERMRGLLGRDSLADAEGMWFPRCRLIHTFGMRFAIDLVYLDERIEVCKIVESLRPGRLSACLGATSVIELKTGAARRFGLSRGTALRIEQVHGS